MSEIKNITNIFNFKKTETTIQKTCTHYKNKVQIYMQVVAINMLIVVYVITIQLIII